MIDSKGSSGSEWLRSLTAAQNGDAIALGALLQEFWDPLWRDADQQIDQKLKAKQAASDLVQETFVEARKSIVDFRGTTRAEFYAWIRSIMFNNVRDVWRRYAETSKRDISAEQPLDSSATLQARTRSTRDVAANLLRSESSELLKVAMQRLPEHYQEVLRLRHWEGLTYEAIGEKMGRTTAAVRQIWYRAIEALSEHLESTHD